MRTNSDTKRTRLIALFAMIFAIVGAFALVPKIAVAEDETITPQDTSVKLEVTNTVIGEDKSFDFTITITADGEVQPVAGDGYVEPTITEENTYTYKVSLGNGQKVAFEVQPESTAATVSITETSESGYTTSYKIGTDSLMPGNKTENISVQEDTTVAFTNTQVTLTTSIDPKSIQLPLTETATLTDTISIVGLLNQAYTVQGELVTQDGKETVATAQTEATGAEDPNATTTAKLEYALDSTTAEKYSGQSLVSTVKVFEKDAKDPIATHEDLADANQTVTIVPAPTLKISKTVSAGDTFETAIELATAAVSAAQTAVDQAATTPLKQGAQALLEQAEARLKSLQDNQSEIQSKEFEFTIAITDADGKAVKASYDYTGAAEGKLTKGKGTVKLKGGQSITIADLPIGYKYTVKETQMNNWTANKDEFSGTIDADGETADFVNSGRGSFSISKTIKAADGVELTDSLKETEFTFTVNFYNDLAKLIATDKSYAYEGSKSGTAKSGDTITLKGGDTIIFKDLDPGIYVRVIESPKTNWTASTSTLGGYTLAGKTRTADFVNTYKPTNNGGGGNGSSSSVYTPTVRRATTTTTSRTTSSTPKTADPASIAPALASASLAIAAAGYAVRKRK